MKVIVVFIILVLVFSGIAFFAIRTGHLMSSVVPAGDATRGQAVFAKYQCANCHTLHGEAPPAGTVQTVKIQLGGKKKMDRDGYARSIMDPNRSIDKDWARIVEAAGETGATQSPMLHAGYSAKMTMTELVDLVTYLEKF